MARQPRGRKAAKNEVAGNLLAALKFGNVLKAATVTSPIQAHYVWMNTGTAIMFDGIVAAGHPIPADVAGYPHAKLFADALENTDKSFTLTVHQDGKFEIGSDKYNAIVPALEYDKVIQTAPDAAQGLINNPENLMAAFANALKVTTETGDTVLYSSVRITKDATVMATNGAVFLETKISDNLPPVILPRQFVAAVVKAAATLKPTGVGIGMDWKSLTIWFENGAWLRTNLYSNDAWPNDAIDLFYRGVNMSVNRTDLDPKGWAAIGQVLPFAVDRVIMRPGIIRTHPDRKEGAALEVKEATATFDVDGKQFLALAEIAKFYGVTEEFEVPLMLVFGDNCRGIVAGLEPLPEPAAGQTAGNWGNQQSEGPKPTVADGWGNASAVQMIDPPGDLNPEGNWKKGPEQGLAYDPAHNSQLLDQPQEDFTDPDAYVLQLPGDQGFTLSTNQPSGNNDGFSASGWVNGLTDADAGIKG